MAIGSVSHTATLFTVRSGKPFLAALSLYIG
jgi:hypothetical protein